MHIRSEKGQRSDLLFARLGETAGFINGRIKAQKGYNITFSKTVPLYCIFFNAGMGISGVMLHRLFILSAHRMGKHPLLFAWLQYVLVVPNLTVESQ